MPRWESSEGLQRASRAGVLPRAERRQEEDDRIEGSGPHHGQDIDAPGLPSYAASAPWADLEYAVGPDSVGGSKAVLQVARVVLALIGDEYRVCRCCRIYFFPLAGNADPLTFRYLTRHGRQCRC